MFVNCDVKGLEWVAGTYLSQCPVALNEIVKGIDQHAANQEQFGLGEGKAGRLVAKVFVFRLIYGGTEFSYCNDPDFTGVSTNPKFWRKVIDEFYSKYTGWAKWHTSLMQEATTSGRIVLPTGRSYLYSPTRRGGDLVWPRTTILNYPVQGLGADLLSLARVRLRRRWGGSGIICSTVHDSLIMDVPSNEAMDAGRLMKECVEEIPNMFEKWFGHKWNVPLTAEVEYGMDLKNMEPLVLTGS